MPTSSEFKTACKKAGLALGAVLYFRLLTYALVLLLDDLLKGLHPEISYLISTVASVILFNGGIIVASAYIFGYKWGDNKDYYKKCSRMGKAVSWVLPTYGAGQVINFAVIAISLLFANNENALQDTYAPIINRETSTSCVVMIALVIQLVVIAPLFEEFWVRGIIQTGLSKYGHGFSIMVSALIFGLAHGNVHQFCFTFVIGIALGYVRYAADSIVPTTIIHFILNSIATVILLLTSCDPIKSGYEKLEQGLPLDNAENVMFAVLGVVMLAVIIFMAVGIVNAIIKLKNNCLYRPVNNYPELTKKEKTITLIKEPVFMISLVLSVIYMIIEILI